MQVTNNQTHWQLRVRRVVTGAIERNNARWGRAYATFLHQQATALDRAFGTSHARLSPAQRKREPYRTAVRLLRSLGYTQREIADVLKLSQSAVFRLLRARKDEHLEHL